MTDKFFFLFFDQVHDAFGLQTFTFGLYKQRNQKEEIVSSPTKTVQTTGLKHGDMLYMAPVNGAALWDIPTTSSASNNISSGKIYLFI